MEYRGGEGGGEEEKAEEKRMVLDFKESFQGMFRPWVPLSSLLLLPRDSNKSR